jgi:hypothetical protein
MGNKGSRDDDDEETEKKEEKPMSIKDHKKALVSANTTSNGARILACANSDLCSASVSVLHAGK